MSMRLFQIVAALGLATALGGCNSVGYATCYREECPHSSPHHNDDAGYVPAYAIARPPSGGPLYDDPFTDYTQRSLTISPGAGNAQAANLSLQTTTPWPRYSQDTNIPGNGAQMVKAINEFESGTRESENKKRLLPDKNSNITIFGTQQ